MDVAHSTNELILLALALIGAGVATGFLAGLLGVGGGAIITPVLYEVFSILGISSTVRMHLAVGTSLAIMAPTTLRAFAAHKARGGVDMPAFKRLAPSIIAGVVLGAAVASYAPGTALKWLWVTFATIMSLKLLPT